VFKNVREDSAYVVLIDKKDREVEIFASCKDKFKKSFDQYDLISIT
ncbi:MAG: hypothetical protein GTN99_00805, partial [Candidatus Dadabacteria bacterium]|nr:hypothetical protein [Candidatus Dadabacteria bacterium]